MAETTKRQDEYLEYVRMGGAAGRTVRAVATHMGVTGSNAADVLKKLLRAGVVTEDRTARALIYRAV